MRIVHHSNYVKWMEEARTDFFKKAGFPWAYMERELQIMIPVRFQSVTYRYAIRFDDVVRIVCTCDKFDGVQMNFSYEFRNTEEGSLLAKGITKHGFINADFEPVHLRDVYSEGYEILNLFINGRKL